MVKYDENGDIVVGLLDDTRVLSKTIIERYNYKNIKDNFDYLIEILENQKLFGKINPYTNTEIENYEDIKEYYKQYLNDRIDHQ